MNAKFITLALCAVLVYGCKQATEVPVAGNVKISVRSSRIVSGLSKSAAGVDSITVTQAQIVIDEIEFENAVEDSMSFELDQPFVQNLSGDTTSYTVAVVNLPFGAYEEMEIAIDKLRMNDGDVYDANPQLQDLSIYVAGYVNGDTAQSFIFTSAIMEEQEREFDPPLVIDVNSPTTNVVWMIDVNAWFVNGNSYVLDPRLPQNQRTIERNIRASISMYEDEDDDGEDDDEGDDDGL